MLCVKECMAGRPEEHPLVDEGERPLASLEWHEQLRLARSQDAADEPFSEAGRRCVACFGYESFSRYLFQLSPRNILRTRLRYFVKDFLSPNF